MAFFTELEQKKILKFVWNPKRPQIAKVILRKELGYHNPRFQNILQSYSNKKKSYQHQNRHMKEINRDPRNKFMLIWSINQ